MCWERHGTGGHRHTPSLDRGIGDGVRYLGRDSLAMGHTGTAKVVRQAIEALPQKLFPELVLQAAPHCRAIAAPRRASAWSDCVGSSISFESDESSLVKIARILSALRRRCDRLWTCRRS